MNVSLDEMNKDVRVLVDEQLARKVEDIDWEEGNKEALNEFITAIVKFICATIDPSKIVSQADLDECNEQSACKVSMTLQSAIGVDPLCAMINSMRML